ncbi:MAG: 4-(cytidine 5'-diphospho)-2-C-methyl-D-erythritol kinase [Candidatus Omnitrophica bacterium]|nr:4-(cytidine 5'-diphospho)-2-C-methyl-D-erythritol kinase [Candidatus Omnitrophota bacterium]
MQTLKAKAPAKLNLYLNVLRRRPDGFHDIETIFEKIDLCDEITLIKRPRGIKISCRHKGVPGDKRNLAARAAQLLFSKTKYRRGVEIRIKKNIPVAAGLGGGSSDAACVLSGLSRLLQLKVSRGQLHKLAEQVGADVPFFVSPRIRAIGRGKGEILSPLLAKPKNWYVLVIPKSVSVSTRGMYQDPTMVLTKRPGGVKIVSQALAKGNITALNKYSYNSFEQILRKKYKQIQEIKKALKTLGVSATLISGSGPCVFGIARNRKEAMRISAKLRAKSKIWRIIAAATLK